MDAFTSSDGALRLAIAALLAVVGYRLARPARAADWIAAIAYVGALAAVYLADRAAPTPALPLVLRVTGAVALVAGLVVAGAPARAARAGSPPGARVPPPAPGPRERWLVHGGLALVLMGQLLRAPTRPAVAAVAVAAAVLAATAWLRRR